MYRRIQCCLGCWGALALGHIRQRRTPCSLQQCVKQTDIFVEPHVSSIACPVPQSEHTQRDRKKKIMTHHVLPWRTVSAFSSRRTGSPASAGERWSPCFSLQRPPMPAAAICIILCQKKMVITRAGGGGRGHYFRGQGIRESHHP